ncbi:cyclic nucleotide phosphodiesterase [Holotrichia oblita]|uniref:Cyclic nucleotide phosphodiesterase n=1 Tax=Holotrichia oblita TaxID=644536 RepID=A0ACB9SQX3_HOLOL|nr:cyclic nucleotide phosphodiesterase [Holotrichia oblita]
MSEADIKLKRKRYGKLSKRKLDISKLSITGYTSERAAMRVIAPYVNIVRKGRKATLKPEGDEEHFMFYLKKKPSVLTRRLTEFLDDSVNLQMLIYETTESLKRMTNATGSRIYLMDQMTNELYLASRGPTNHLRRIRWKVQPGKTVAAHAAYTMLPLIVDDIAADPRFDNAVPFTDLMIKSVLAVPVLTPENTCYAVLEIFRDVLQDDFKLSDLNISVMVANWMGTAVYMNEQKIILTNRQQLNSCLLELTKCFLTDMGLFDKMIMEIVSVAKLSLNAERATFYVIDPQRDDLVSDIYDECVDQCDDTVKRSLKLRFSNNRGIAKHVATTGQTLNLRDAFNDPRFIPEYDERTGLLTRSVICMPVTTVDGTVGVLQAINKKDAVGFTEHDEEMFSILSTHCALALRFSHVYKVNRKAQARCDITVGLIKRHVLPCPHDFEHLLRNMGIYENTEALRNFSWYIDLQHLDNMPQIAIHLLIDLCGHDAFVYDELVKFMLTVRNFYRKNITYHNWEHGFNVCHCMYNLILRNKYTFTDIERKALMVATLGHDLDHGGVTNNFLATTHDVMAQLYNDSIWESHHYEVLLIILSEIPIFKNINAEEFVEICKVMRNAIIATDLANYFKIKTEIHPIIAESTFMWELQEHRRLGLCMMMTMCDLSGQCKPFQIAKRLVYNLYVEFYAQGDREKELGLASLSLNDRTKAYFQPEDQILFLNILVLPVADVIRSILENCDSLYTMAEYLKADWEELIAIRDGRCWRQEESLVTEVPEDPD